MHEFIDKQSPNVRSTMAELGRLGAYNVHTYAPCVLGCLDVVARPGGSPRLGHVCALLQVAVGYIGVKSSLDRAVDPASACPLGDGSSHQQFSCS